MSSKFEDISKRRGMRIFFMGMFMGIADLVPGISGGTIAFIMGIYEELLKSIKSFNFSALSSLFCLRFKKFKKEVRWKFLFFLTSGILFSLIMFSKLIHIFMQQSIGRIYLYSFFLGFILGSIRYFHRKIIKWKAMLVFFLFLGMSISLSCGFYTVTSTSLMENEIFWKIKLIVSGMIAVMAMLLPGISGSFIFLLLGVYAPTIQALAQVSEGSTEALFFLSHLGLGILLGAVLFSRAILFLLKRYKDKVVCFLMGLMLGSIYVIWPFGQKIHAAFTRQTVELSNNQFLMSILLLFLGYFLFSLTQRQKQKKQLSFID